MALERSEEIHTTWNDKRKDLALERSKEIHTVKNE